MSEQSAGSYQAKPYDREASGTAQGFIVFAGVMMILAGSFQTITGVVAVFEDEFYVTTPNYLLQLDATSWGWIHILIGLIVLFAGIGVMSGRILARIVGITLATISAFANFAFIPYYPFWSLTIIVLNIFVIWALSVHGRDILR